MKKGFTLVELLAIIILLSVIVVFVVPKIIDTLNGNKSKLGNVQKNEIKEAASLYIEDTCINPISDETVCEYSTTRDEEGNILIVSGIIPLETLGEKEYISSSNIIKNCEGNILIENNKFNLSEIKCEF